MLLPSLLELISLYLVASVTAAPVSVPAVGSSDLVKRQIPSYAPRDTDCPSTSLVRDADGISAQEASYISSRKAKADIALAAWLSKQGNFNNNSHPVVALASSGGGYRALLETAGVVQAFDSRDSNVSTSGLYQGLTYHSGLSGGSWFLSSQAGNNWPTVSSLQEDLWEDSFDNSLLVPANLLSLSGLTQYGLVTTDLLAKQDAGYDTTIVDPWGRLLSYQLLDGFNGGVGTTLSGLTSLSNFKAANVPYPIITTTTNFPEDDQCFPTVDGPIFEFHPYEYGSWDEGISAFAKTKYMGTEMDAGEPADSDECTRNYDNLGYILGTSSDIFPITCSAPQPASNSPFQDEDEVDLASALEGLVALTHEPVVNDLFGIYPNPFYNSPDSPLVAEEENLRLSDGGLANQNVPIWPFLFRDVDVLIANDNSADTDNNFPNGAALRQTYLNARTANLTRMPFIPPVETFVSQGLNKRATFFGCDGNNATMMIVYLPNVNYTYESNTPTAKLEYSERETKGMVGNGVEIATQGGEEGWAFCLACAMKHRDGMEGLPSGCGECFEKYCYWE
ncbi:hypothetical protein LTR37_005313 [Vermiconidia calcicola]|uniref:Uncharacterized protein n=1 Tax=Vermiconidia calcicola TaxID=1690605 RepID=A0ACC3NK32_9PEZI|nr:hypothetical protein LTR37_005313 [Vermiconidia calcicola]